MTCVSRSPEAAYTLRRHPEQPGPIGSAALSSAVGDILGRCPRHLQEQRREANQLDRSEQHRPGGRKVAQPAGMPASPVAAVAPHPAAVAFPAPPYEQIRQAAKDMTDALAGKQSRAA